MTIQFDRRIEVRVGDVDIKDLHASFRVVKTLKKDPNTYELTIFGLAKDTRDRIAQAEDPVLEIRAGFHGRETPSGALASVDAALGALDAIGLGGPVSESTGFGVIALSNVRTAFSSFEPPEWVTSIEGGDGEKRYRTSRINRSFAAGTSLRTILIALADAMAVGVGNAVSKAATATLIDAGNEFLNGVTLSGQASKIMDQMMKSADLEWSIQDGVIQVLDQGAVLEDISVVLRDNSGLIGSPTIGADGVIRLRALLNSDIVPGRQLEVFSQVLSGGSKALNRFRVERVEYLGSNYDDAYFCDIEASEL